MNIVMLYPKLTFPFLFDAAVKENLSLHLVLNPAENPPELKEIQALYPCVVDVELIDIFSDENSAIASLGSYVARCNIQHLICFRDEAIPFTAKASQILGLPLLNKPDVCFHARDKSLTRKLMQEAGCNVPQFVKVGQSTESKEFSTLRYPVVAKPSSGFGSIGVTRVDNEEDISKIVSKIEELNQSRLSALSRFEGSNYEAVLVEEFIDGPEFVAETYSVEGCHHVLVVGEKGDPKGPYFEESIYIAPARIPKEDMDAIELEVSSCLSAIGFQNGPAHVELRINQNDGKPYVLEIGARIGGSGVSEFVVNALYGLSILAICNRHLNGEDVSSLIEKCKSQTPDRLAINYIIPIGEGGVVRKIHGIEEVRAHRDTVRIIEFMKKGQTANPYPDFNGYPGFILSCHGSHADAEGYLDMLKQDVRVEYG